LRSMIILTRLWSSSRTVPDANSPVNFTFVMSSSRANYDEDCQPEYPYPFDTPEDALAYIRSACTFYDLPLLVMEGGQARVKSDREIANILSAYPDSEIKIQVGQDEFTVASVSFY